MMTEGPRKDPLHGMTLEAILQALVAHYGWEALGGMLDIRCFTHEPSIPSSLKFLRRTPWARARVEDIYRRMLSERPRPLVFGKK
jgi:uncharacterized protein (DUF2132 family)